MTERFPGFNSHLGVQPRPRTEHQIAELERMAADDRLSGPAIEGLRAYLDARRQAMGWVNAFASRSSGFGSSNETAWIRAWLRERATEIVQRFPEFLPLWERALSRELADEDEPIEPRVGGARYRWLTSAAPGTATGGDSTEDRGCVVAPLAP